MATNMPPEMLEAAAAQDMRDMIARLQAENERLRAKSVRSLTLKVSEKGAVSVYGLMRFPVTLYAETWLKLLAVADDIKLFIRDNASRLATK